MDNLSQGSTAIPNNILFDYTLPAGLLVSLLRLQAVAGGAMRQVGPLDFDRGLIPLMGVKSSQARAHLRALRMAKLLHWSVDSAGRYTVFLAIPEFHQSGSQPSVEDVDVNNQNIDDGFIQQQQTNAEKPSSLEGAAGLTGSRDQPDALSVELETLMDDPVSAEVLQWLAQAGVWTDRAARIARQIAENERRRKYYLPVRGDVLGWIAFCFAYQTQHKIIKPVQVLAANLVHNRRCPKNLLPPRVCAACKFEEGRCQCHGEPDYGYPAEFIEFAFRAEYNEYAQTFWGICKSCHAYPCQCPEVGAEFDEEDDEVDEIM